VSTAGHPGYAATNLQSHSQSALLEFLTERIGNPVLAQDAAGGALPSCTRPWPACRATASPGREGCSACGARRNWSAGRARPGIRTPPARLWAVSEELTGVTFPLPG
jgi:hypothetical protein